MKKQILSVATAMLFVLGTLSLTSCGKKSNTDEHGHTEEHADEHAAHDHDAMEEAMPEAGAEKMEMGEKTQNLSMIIDSYLALKNALAADNSTDAAAAGVSMMGAFKRFDQAALSEEQAKGYAEMAESAFENAEHISKNASEIVHQREHLVALSEDINDMIALVGTDKKLYQDFCPMANKNKGAMWISETEEISNPYMGSKMPKCGSMKMEIN